MRSNALTLMAAASNASLYFCTATGSFYKYFASKEDVLFPDADTRVKTAVAWLERARFLQRDENHTRMFPASLKVPTLDEARARLAKADLSEAMRAK